MGAMKRVLVANRGEIAVRIIRACRELGMETVAVFSDPDARALHVRQAHRGIRIGPASPVESYLNVDAIIDAARTAGADAIHPGYGFLSERSAFARACEDAGITFVGPASDVIDRMGSKIAARDLMRSAGVPVVPGETPPDQSDAGIVATAARVGFPALIKASAGGGGKGMRTVRSESDARDAVGAARREAVTAFGDGTLYVERLIERPRHIEIQVLGDAHGNVVHLFERECSLQRRHQKIVEESPSPALTAEVRRRMGEAAVAAARAVGYRNAGTIEFLFEGEGDSARFYFLEMNTRLQVEHPVTELVTGVDLVRAQLRVAAGERLPWTQEALTQRGHAIECRVYAEDPSNEFLPQAGTLLVYREPSGPGVRVDSGVTEGDAIGVHYDPLIAKLVTHGETRDAAIARADGALRTFPILGIRSNVAFLARLIAHPAFRRSAVDTAFVDEHAGELAAADASPARAEALAAAAAARPASHGHEVRPAVATTPDPWATLGGWGRATA
jgi:acetyl-CoA carboxylase biotin carboxylase subunit